MLESEMNEHLGYEKYEHSSEGNYRNGKKTKKIRSQYGEMDIDVPQDRDSTFEPGIVPKRKKDISEIENKVISLYSKGVTTSQIRDIIMDIYGFEISEGLISDITDKLLPKIEEWQNRPLSSVYPIIFIDAVHFSVRDSGIFKTCSQVLCARFGSALADTFISESLRILAEHLSDVGLTPKCIFLKMQYH